MICLFLSKMPIMVKNKKLIFHLLINVEYVADLEQSQDQNQFLVPLVEDKVKLGQAKVFLQFNKPARIVLVQGSKFLAHAKSVEE